MRLLLVQGDTSDDPAVIADCLSQRYLPGFDLATFYAGSSSRALATAQAIVLALESELTLTDALAGPADATDAALAEAQARAWSLVEELRERLQPTDAVVLVADEALVRALICRALGLELAARERFRIDPGSISAIDVRQRLLVSRINDTRHLSAAAGSAP